MRVADRADFFREATVAICSSLQIEESLANCFQYLRSYIPLDEMNLHLFEHEKGVIRTIVAVTESDRKQMDVETPIPVEGTRLMKGNSLDDLRIVNDPTRDIVTRRMIERFGKSDSSFVILRLVVNDGRLGTITFRADGRERYTEGNAELIKLLKEPLAIALANALMYREVVRLQALLKDDNHYLQEQLYRQSGNTIIGEESGLKQVMKLARQVAPLGSPVLLLGETGVGKEVVANAIHYGSKRRNKPFIKVNCGALPENLIDSELFGHEKGAFTGAVAARRGRFERADSGTIFLDEIGELPPQAQIRLLRVLQNKELERVGGIETFPIDVRVIAATHRNLKELVRTGLFREDLWFRLNVFPVTIPPLRNRSQDIPELVSYFLASKCREFGINRLPELSAASLSHLMKYDWPGNVRELENIIERALIVRKGDKIFPHDLIEPGDMRTAPIAPWKPENQPPPDFNLDRAMGDYISRVMDYTHGRINGRGGAAELLGMHPNTLRFRLKKLGIQFGRSAKTGPK